MSFGNCGVLPHVEEISGCSFIGVWRTGDGLREVGSGLVARRGSLPGPSHKLPQGSPWLSNLGPTLQ